MPENRLEGIRNVYIAGAGVMGSSMGQIFASCGYPVTLYDISAEAIEKSRALTKINLGTSVETGRLTEEAAEAVLAGITYT